MEVQYFGASSLQIKISRFWHEIPADSYALFREKLIDAVMFYSSGPKIVLTRLCLAVSKKDSLTILYTSPIKCLLSISKKSFHP